MLQGKHDPLAFADFEVSADRPVDNLDRNVAAGDDEVRAYLSGDRAFLRNEPRRDGPIAEAKPDVGLQGDVAFKARDDPDDARTAAAANRHEVNEASLSRRGREHGFEDQGVAAIAARHLRMGILGRHAPTAVFLIAQEGRKTGIAIEAGPAEPVDRTVPSDERDRLAVADHGVVLNPLRHDDKSPALV